MLFLSSHYVHAFVRHGIDISCHHSFFFFVHTYIHVFMHASVRICLVIYTSIGQTNKNNISLCNTCPPTRLFVNFIMDRTKSVRFAALWWSQMPLCFICFHPDSCGFLTCPLYDENKTEDERICKFSSAIKMIVLLLKNFSTFGHMCKFNMKIYMWIFWKCVGRKCQTFLKQIR
jgi:hypothetical protein